MGGRKMRYVDEQTKEFIASGAVLEGRKIYRSKRIDQLRELIINAAPMVCSDRALLVTQSYQETEQEPAVIRRAKAMEHVLNNVEIKIWDGELIVGTTGHYPRCTQFFPEFGMEWMIEELDGNPVRPENRPGDLFLVTPEDEANIRSIAPYWKGKTHYDRVRARIPEDAWKAYDEINVINSYWLMIGGEGHLVVNLKRVVREGLNSFKKQAEEKLKSLDLTEPDQMKQVAFLQAAIQCCDAVTAFAGRYARLAIEMAKTEQNPQREKELMKIAEICSHVPGNPARNFHEALQACWFINVTLQIENNGHSISLGRLDQSLIDYYRQDVASGELTPEDAVELLNSFYLKLFQICKITPWKNTKSFMGYPLSMTQAFLTMKNFTRPSGDRRVII